MSIQMRQAPCNDFGPKDANVQVNSRVSWVSTHLCIQAGQRVTIRVNAGTWTIDKYDLIRFPFVDARGYSEIPDWSYATGAFLGSLIGRIGDEPAFYIGAEQSIQAEQKGELWLRINDTSCCLENNDGTLEVLVHVEE